MTSTFEQSVTTTVINGGFTYGVYFWSTAANWVGGVPTDGGLVEHDITVSGNPSGYDDIAGLSLDSLLIDAGQVAVGGSLEIGTLSFGTVNFPSIYSDTLLGSSAATLVVDGFGVSNFGEIGAFGTHALTVVQSLTDPGGETYQVDDGGELLLVPTPQYNSSVISAGFYYENSVASGTFAFRNPSATITSPLGGVAIGDAIALPGTDVSSVTYGSNSIAVVTNEGTVDFSNVGYSGTRPAGFVATPDPISGLERITFASQQVTGFQQGQTTQIVENGFTFGVYLWSTAANWTNGVPDTGAAVTHNITVAGNPSGYDDLAGLFLDSVAVTAGQIAVGGSLEIGSISFGTANFPSIYSDTLLGSSAATLVVDGFSGSNFGEIGAFGTHALTVVQSLTDPGGETYQVDDGGELLLVPTPQYNSSVFSAGFYYENSVASGTFAFRNPSGTIASPLGGVAIGDAIALPGTDVSSVTYGSNSIAIVTNKGTVDFSNVSYSGTHPTGFVATPDVISGLEQITFASQQNTSFQQSQTTQIVENGFTFGVYLWSTAANWTNGAPGAGAAVTHNITVPGNPSGYDDVAGLFLDSVAVTAGQIAVGGSLEIGSISFGTANFPSIYSDTLLGSSSATLVVDGFSGSNFGEIGAFGTHALTVVQSLTDPGGETYQVDDGGELLLVPTPQYNSSVFSAGFYYENSVASGTFAFRNPSATITSPLGGVAIGDAIALPGTDVSSVTYSDVANQGTITVVTNVGTTTFNNVGYVPNEVFTGYTVATDPISGLERITFAGYQTTSFQQGQTTQIVENGFTFGVYLWSTAANWTNGIPSSGEGVTHNITVPGNPSGYDDIADLDLASVLVTAGQIAVGGSLEIGALNFGTANFPSIYSDTLLGSSSATLVVDGFSGSNFGEIGAFGSHALTVVQSLTDPGGETYQVDDGGELLLDPTPQYNSSVFNAGLYYENSVPTGTFAFRNPGGTITAPLGGVAIGDSIALPGSAVSLVSYSDSAGSGTITVVTNLGTTTFANVFYASTSLSAEPTGFVATPDPISGLERITFAQPTATSFQQVTTATVGSSSEYLWSDPTNWTSGAPVNGSTVTFNPSGTALPSGYDDISNLFLDVLGIDRGMVAVGNTLTVARLSFSEAGLRGIEADTEIAGGSAAVLINSLSNIGGGTIAAVGTDAVTIVQASVDRGEIYQAINGGMVILSSTPVIGSQFTFDAGTIAFENPGITIASTLANVAIADAIELPGTDVTSVTFGSNSLTAVTSAGTTTFSNVGYATGSAPEGFVATPDLTTGLEEITFTLCFCGGTQILTPRGEVLVERLAIGDLVMTVNGESKPIKWIGSGRVLATRGARGAATPVIVRRGALADDVPHRDLHVTKGHSLYVDGVLIPVEELINQRSILWDDRAQEVQIFHIELATHDVLVANGALAESYRDDGNRWLFRNVNSAWEAEPKSPYAPVLNNGPVVDAAWRRLLERAGAPGEMLLTDDHDLHLLADGKRIDPIERRDALVAFRLAATPRRVRLVSRFAVPQELGIARDPRRLGVAIRRLVAAQGRRQRAIEAHDERLADGYHAYEADGSLRWTNGDAEVPRTLFTSLSGPSMLLVHLAARTTYADAEDLRRVA